MYICTVNLNVSSRVLGLTGKEHLHWCCRNKRLCFSWFWAMHKCWRRSCNAGTDLQDSLLSSHSQKLIEVNNKTYLQFISDVINLGTVFTFLHSGAYFTLLLSFIHAMLIQYQKIIRNLFFLRLKCFTLSSMSKLTSAVLECDNIDISLYQIHNRYTK